MRPDRLNAVVLHVALDPITGPWSVMRDLALAQAASHNYAAVGIGVISSAAWPGWYARELAEIGLPSYRCKTPRIFGTAQFLWQRLQRPPVHDWVTDLMKMSGASHAIVHFHNAWMSGVFLPLDIVDHERVEVIVTMHGMFANFGRKPFRRGLHRWMASRLLRYHARLTSVDRPGTIQAESLLGIPRASFTVIPNGVTEDQTLHGAPWDGEGVFQLGCLGNLEERKGWQIGARAAIKLAAQGMRIRYIIAGEGPQRREAISLQQSYPGIIEYLGHVFEPRRNLLPRLHALSLMSSNEGLPMSIVEALSTGLPVIATRVGGIPETIKDDISGLLVSRDPESLARAVSRLYDNPSEHARLGFGGKRLFRETFELSSILQQYHEVYLESLQGRRHSSLGAVPQAEAQI